MGELQLLLRLAPISCVLLHPPSKTNVLLLFTDEETTQRGRFLQITEVTSNRAREEGAPEGEGKDSKGEATGNPGAWLLTRVSRPEPDQLCGLEWY